MSGASFPDHFSGVSSSYAQFRPRYPAALFSFLAQLCERRERAWDCACGSGQASLGIVEHFGQVIATDASAAQIAEAPPNPRIEYRVAPAEASGLEGQSVDLVTVAQALHWFDLERFYAEVRRVLRPGGVLAVWVYGRLVLEGPEVNARVQDFYRRIAPFWPPGREHVDDGYRQLGFPFPEVPVPSFEIEDRWTAAHLAGYARSWSATARYIGAHGQDPVADLEASLAPLWAADEPRGIRWPLSLRCGRTP